MANSQVTNESGGRQNMFPSETRPYIDESVSYDGYPQNAEKVNGRWAMATRGVATGDEPESMYMVTAGDRYNGACCFDYGNAEVGVADFRGRIRFSGFKLFPINLLG